MPECIHQSRPVARKRHECDVCRSSIEPGTRYIRSLNKMDDVYTFIEHEECARVGSAFLHDVGDPWEGYHDEFVRECLSEYQYHEMDGDQQIVWDRMESARREASRAIGGNQ